MVEARVDNASDPLRFEDKGVSEKMTRWIGGHLRAFPWRIERNATPYSILIAELLLKRTTAAAAAKVYESFFTEYGSLEGLLSASLTELEEQFRPIGLHFQRAAATKQLVDYLAKEHALEIPESLEDLLKVPGIGEYSSRAILSFGFGKPYAIVDGNVKRVLGRVYFHRIGLNAPLASYQYFADSIVPSNEHREFNFGMIDLGSTICRPTNPKCSHCPLQPVCDYSNTDRTNIDLPSLSKEIVNARAARQMSLVRLASLSGVSKLTIVNIEQGRTKPKPKTIEKLLRVLN